MAEAPRYFRVATRFWTDEKSSCWDDDIKLLALYLLTCPHRTTEGIFRLPKSYALGDLGWSQRRLNAAWKVLVSGEFLQYDDKAQVALLTHALRYQAPENPNQMKAARKSFETLPATPLKARFLELAKQLAPVFHEALTKQLGEPLPKPIRHSPSLNSISQLNNSISAPETTSPPHAADCPPRGETPVQRLTASYREAIGNEDPKDFGRIGKLVKQHGENAVGYAIGKLATASLDSTIERPFAWLAKVAAQAPPPPTPRRPEPTMAEELAAMEHRRLATAAREARQRAAAEAPAGGDAGGTG